MGELMGLSHTFESGLGGTHKQNADRDDGDLKEPELHVLLIWVIPG